MRNESHIHFLPWVGKRYYEGIGGKKILVLGESHYCAKPEDDTPFVTRKVIENLLDPAAEHESYKNTYTKFERALAGKVLDWQGKVDLWNSVIFYNFVQRPMTGPRISPEPGDFKDSYAAFFEVLEEYRPDCIIVWGKRLYNNLPQEGHQGPDLQLPDGTFQETWIYTLSGGKRVHVMPVLHPSSGFSWDFWHEAIRRCLVLK